MEKTWYLGGKGEEGEGKEKGGGQEERERGKEKIKNDNRTDKWKR